jgi:opacity protein-like surface antigen
MKTNLTRNLTPCIMCLFVASAPLLHAADPDPLLVPVTLSTALMNSTASSESASDQPGRFSLDADAGVAVMKDLTLTFNGTGPGHMTFDTGFRFDVAARYHLSGGWDADFEAGVVYNTVDQIAGVSLSSIGASAEFTQIPLIVDIIYNIPVHGPFSLYFGAGMGGTVGLFHASGGGENTDHTDFTFGFQGIAGMKYAINDRIDLGLVYKFMGTSDHDFGSGLTSNGSKCHSGMLAFSYKF